MGASLVNLLSTILKGIKQWFHFICGGIRHALFQCYIRVTSYDQDTIIKKAQSNELNMVTYYATKSSALVWVIPPK